MATYDYTKGGVGFPAMGGDLKVVSRVLDFAAIAAARSAAGLTAIANTDVLQIIDVPVNTWVLGVRAECLVVEGAALTVDIGDGGSTAGYASLFSLNSLAGTNSLATVALSVATAGGKFYAAADTIDVLVNTAGADAAKLLVVAVMVDLRQIEQIGT